MQPTEDDVRRQLDRLLASSGFANAGRMSRFLKFVVERSLAGEGERLKEYVIGVEVFDRDTDYDPRVDSIVRVEAARLRSKLAEYYAGDGRDDAVVLSLPKGGYAAIVKTGNRLAATNGMPAANGTASIATNLPHARPPRPTRVAWALGAVVAAGVAAALVAWGTRPSTSSPLRVAVLPFTADPTDADGSLAQRLTEGVTAELVRDGRFSVIASSAARAEYSAARRPRDIGAALEADVLVQARIRAQGDSVHIETYAVSGEREQKLWVRGFEGSRENTDTLEREVAAAIAETLTSTAATQ